MVRTQIQLTEGQSSHLREIALIEKVSIAELIRRSVDNYLQGYTVPSYEERKRNALAVIGIADSGLGDLSANHVVGQLSRVDKDDHQFSSHLIAEELKPNIQLPTSLSDDCEDRPWFHGVPCMDTCPLQKEGQPRIRQIPRTITLAQSV